MLKIFIGRPVSVSCVDGQIYFGVVDNYFPESNENNEESIVLKSLDNKFIEFVSSEIASVAMCCQ